MRPWGEPPEPVTGRSKTLPPAPAWPLPPVWPAGCVRPAWPGELAAPLNAAFLDRRPAAPARAPATWAGRAAWASFRAALNERRAPSDAQPLLLGLLSTPLAILRLLWQSELDARTMAGLASHCSLLGAGLLWLRARRGSYVAWRR